MTIYFFEKKDDNESKKGTLFLFSLAETIQ